MPKGKGKGKKSAKATVQAMPTPRRDGRGISARAHITPTPEEREAVGAFAAALYVECGGSPGSMAPLLPHGDQSESHYAAGPPRGRLGFPVGLKGRLSAGEMAILHRALEATRGPDDRSTRTHATATGAMERDGTARARRPSGLSSLAGAPALPGVVGSSSRASTTSTAASASGDPGPSDEALITIMSMFCVACLDHHHPRSMEQDHMEAYALIRDKVTRLLNHLNAPGNERFARLLTQDPRFRGMFEYNDATQKYTLTGSGARLIYGNPNNMWLLCRVCNGGKTDEGTRAWLLSRAVFGPEFVASVERGGVKIQEGVLFARLHPITSNTSSVTMGGQQVLLHPEETESMVDLTMKWFVDHYLGAYEAMNEMQVGMVDRVRRIVKGVMDRPPAERERAWADALVAIREAVDTFEVAHGHVSSRVGATSTGRLATPVDAVVRQDRRATVTGRLDKQAILEQIHSRLLVHLSKHQVDGLIGKLAEHPDQLQVSDIQALQASVEARVREYEASGDSRSAAASLVFFKDLEDKFNRRQSLARRKARERVHSPSSSSSRTTSLAADAASSGRDDVRLRGQTDDKTIDDDKAQDALKAKPDRKRRRNRASISSTSSTSSGSTTTVSTGGLPTVSSAHGHWGPHQQPLRAGGQANVSFTTATGSSVHAGQSFPLARVVDSGRSRGGVFFSHSQVVHPSARWSVQPPRGVQLAPLLHRPPGPPGPPAVNLGGPPLVGGSTSVFTTVSTSSSTSVGPVSLSRARSNPMTVSRTGASDSVSRTGPSSSSRSVAPPFGFASSLSGTGPGGGLSTTVGDPVDRVVFDDDADLGESMDDHPDLDDDERSFDCT